jgi:ADP-ribosyl-[dinitrogen reductase] hydrolase
MNQLERYRGTLHGLAAGDVLGAPLEGLPPGSFEPVSGITGGGSHSLEPGHWTDDTSMALCLAESLLERRGFDPVDQLSRYVRWYREGHLSSTGYCFGMGSTTREALMRFEKSGEPYSGSVHPNAAGNGSIMRLAPVPLFYARNPEEAIQRSADSSHTTHGAPNCVDACRYFGALVVGAVNGAGKAVLLSERYSPAPGLWEERPLTPEVDEVARGSFKRKEPPEIQGTGYVVRSLEAALWRSTGATLSRRAACWRRTSATTRIPPPPSTANLPAPSTARAGSRRACARSWPIAT